MTPRTHFSAVCLWLFIIAFLLCKNRVENRSTQIIGERQISRPSDEYIDERSLKAKQGDENKAMLDVSVKQKRQLKPSIPCNCNDYCPAPNSTELEVSNRHLQFVKTFITRPC